jgi:hypothetical protein
VADEKPVDNSVILAAINGFKTEMRGELKQVSNRQLEQHQEVQRRFGHMEQLVGELWTTVKGEPPPPAPTPMASTKKDDEGRVIEERPFVKSDPPLGKVMQTAPTGFKPQQPGVEKLAREGIKRASEVGLEFEAFRGEVLGELARINTMNAKQNRVLAVDKRGWEWVKSREGAKLVSSLIAGATGLVIAITSLYAVISGKPTTPDVVTGRFISSAEASQAAPPHVRNAVPHPVEDAGVRVDPLPSKDEW